MPDDLENFRREGRGRVFDKYTDFFVVFNRVAVQASGDAGHDNKALKQFAEETLSEIFQRHGKGGVSMAQASAARVFIRGIDGQMAREIERLPSVESVWPDFEIGAL